MKYDSEQDYVDNLKYTLENLGYSVWTEVVPDYCNKKREIYYGENN